VCTVAAPSRIRRAPADRVKTDRRDAELLARSLRMGELVAVRVPEPHEEAARDFVRGREDVRGDLMRARHRLSKLLLRHGLVYDATAWTLAHDAWLVPAAVRQSAALARVRRLLHGGAADKDTSGRTRRGDRGARSDTTVRRHGGPACLSAGCLDADGARVDGRTARRSSGSPTAKDTAQVDPGGEL
jgi:transposase